MNFGEKLTSDYLSPEKPKDDINSDANLLSNDVYFNKQETEIIKHQDTSALEKARELLDLKSEAIKRLEDTNLIMNTESRVIILLCAEGLKPISRGHVGVEYVNDLKIIAKNLGLSFLISDEVSNSHNTSTGKNYKTVAFTVAKEKEVLDNYFIGHNKWEVNSGIFKEDQKKKINDEAGNMYGYPKTAVDAFANKEARMEIKDYPEEIINSELGELLSKMQLFIKSKAHWQEEVAVYASWMNKIKELSPKIYQMILEMPSRGPGSSDAEIVQSLGSKIKNLLSKIIKK